MAKTLQLLTLAIFISCAGIDENEIQKDVFTYKCTQKHINENFLNYKHLYGLLQDSINMKIENNIYQYSRFVLIDWVLDSLIIVNSDSSLFIASAYPQNNLNKQSDLASTAKFYCYNIEGKWYISISAFQLYPRTEYQNQKYLPMTMDMLKYISRCRNLKSSYLILDDGKIAPNDLYFEMNLSVEGPKRRMSNVVIDEKLWTLRVIENATNNRRNTAEEMDRYINTMKKPRPKEEILYDSWWNKNDDAIHYEKVFDALNLKHN